MMVSKTRWQDLIATVLAMIAVSIKCYFTHIQDHTRTQWPELPAVHNTSRRVQIDKCGYCDRRWYFCTYNIPFSVCYNNTEKQNEKNRQNGD